MSLTSCTARLAASLIRRRRSLSPFVQKREREGRASEGAEFHSRRVYFTDLPISGSLASAAWRLDTNLSPLSAATPFYLGDGGGKSASSVSRLASLSLASIEKSRHWRREISLCVRALYVYKRFATTTRQRRRVIELAVHSAMSSPSAICSLSLPLPPLFVASFLPHSTKRRKGGLSFPEKNCPVTNNVGFYPPLTHFCSCRRR